MLQPVTTVPSAVSSAAPTLNVEKGATARARAPRAASTSAAQACASEPLNDPFQQRRELAADPTRGLHHLVVVQRLRQDAGRHVADARDAEDLHPHVPRDDR